MEMTVGHIRRRIGVTQRDPKPVLRCGWCKGFIHQERVSGMTLFVHDEKPLTNHEVLPYRER